MPFCRPDSEWGHGKFHNALRIGRASKGGDHARKAEGGPREQRLSEGTRWVTRRRGLPGGCSMHRRSVGLPRRVAHPVLPSPAGRKPRWPDGKYLVQSPLATPQGRNPPSLKDTCGPDPTDIAILPMRPGDSLIPLSSVQKSPHPLPSPPRSDHRVRHPGDPPTVAW
jgi:hypothetical protein